MFCRSCYRWFCKTIVGIIFRFWLKIYYKFPLNWLQTLQHKNESWKRYLKVVPLSQGGFPKIWLCFGGFGDKLWLLILSGLAPTTHLPTHPLGFSGGWAVEKTQKNPLFCKNHWSILEKTTIYFRIFKFFIKSLCFSILHQILDSLYKK